MKRFLSALVILSILIAALPALAQGETLDKTYVSHDDVFTFDYPGEWKFAVDIDSRMEQKYHRVCLRPRTGRRAQLGHG
jgi:hypothetical protein